MFLVKKSRPVLLASIATGLVIIMGLAVRKLANPSSLVNRPVRHSPLRAIRLEIQPRVAYLKQLARYLYLRSGKRIIDIVLVSIGLVVLAPLLAFISLLVWLQFGSPILFRQVRPGRDGQPFTIYKFRTMTNARNGNGDLLPDAERLTRFGQFLRHNSLDELPELFNVLKGDMSLVGPRPLIMRYLDRYTPEQARRHDVRPGITGWAQINGRNTALWSTRFAHDVWYVDHCSFWLDLKILLLTVWKVARREGINEEGHVTMSEFMGTPQSQPEYELTAA